MAPKTPDAPEKDPDGSVILRARNGDVIRADDTGLELRLSDRVVGDLRARLGFDAPPDPDVLGDLDAWSLRRTGEWILFEANLPGMDGARGYRRRAAGGHVIAQTPGPVLGLFSLGGARRATGIPGRALFPYHVVAPDDDIGAVGMAGVEPAPPCRSVAGLRERTLDSDTADRVLQQRRAAGRGLPLILARCETDTSASLASLGSGPAMDNLLSDAETLKSVAASLGKEARILAVSVDFLREDVTTPDDAFGDAYRALIARVEQGLWQKGFAAPLFVAMFDGGVTTRIAAQTGLALHPGGHNLIIAGPSYAYDWDRFHRLTEAGMRARAAVEAAAIEEWHAGRGWQCPMPLLAEPEAGGARLRVRTNAMQALRIDRSDPFGAGGDAGFTLAGDIGHSKIESVAVDEAEPRDLLITLTRPLPRRGAVLRYAFGGPGALRDTWEAEGGGSARRWALPAELEVWG